MLEQLLIEAKMYLARGYDVEYVDNYVMHLLKATNPKGKVTLKPNGNWVLSIYENEK